MADNTLDRLDRDPGGARRYVAQLFVVGGATREQVANKLRDKYGVSVTTRIITTWRNNDPELRGMMEELEAIKRDLSPGDETNPADLLRETVDPAEAVNDLLSACIRSPELAKLIKSSVSDEKVGAVLTAEHPTAADLEVACATLLANYRPQTPSPPAPGGFYG